MSSYQSVHNLTSDDLVFSRAQRVDSSEEEDLVFFISKLSTRDSEPKSSGRTCKYCEQFFVSQEEAAQHEANHEAEGRKFFCQVCHAGFTRSSYVQEHMLTHTGQKPHRCPECNLRFALRCNLVRHYRKHTGEKPYECEVCGKSFSLKKNMLDHFFIHTGEKPLNCDKCGRRFARKSSLNRHMSTHDGRKDIVCALCQKKFAWKADVARHLKIHFKKQTKSSVTPGNKIIEETEAGCKIFFKTEDGENKFKQEVDDF